MPVVIDGTTGITTPGLTNSGTDTLSSGTANGVAYLNGSKVLTTGSALTFNGTDMVVDAPAASNANIYISGNGNQATNTGLMLRQNSSNIALIYNRANADMVFGTNNAEQMRLTTTGLGIGTSSPAARLDVLGGSTTAFRAYSSTANIGGIITSFNNTSANYYDADTHTFRFGNGGGPSVVITSSGELRVAGTTDQGAYNIQCNGTGVWGAGAYVNGSDARIKDDIKPLPSSLSVVQNLNPVTFRYKESWSKDTSVQPGFIAQELQQALAGQEYIDGVVMQGPEYMSVAYQTLIPVLTKAIQEQQALIEQLTTRIAALEAK